MSSTMGEKIHRKENPPDRIYPIRADVHYRLMDGDRALGCGSGQTKTMSSRSVWLKSDGSLRIGGLIQLDVVWPVRLNNRVALKLVITGKTVKVEGQSARVDILRHEFRTRALPFEDRTHSTAALSTGRTMTATA